MATAAQLTDEQRRDYAARIGRRLEQNVAQADRDGALVLARTVARMLKEEFGATRVILFGSLAAGAFTPCSDIDMAVEGIPGVRFFAAVARATEIAAGTDIDIIDLAMCRAGLRDRILRVGQEL